MFIWEGKSLGGGWEGDDVRGLSCMILAFSFSKISMSVPQRMVIALRYVSTPMEAISACVIPATSWSRMGRLALVSLDVE